VAVDQRLRPRKRPQQSRSHETRQRILDAAARIFAEHGYSAGTTNRIAAAAGMSIGSLYQYFPNKDAIIVELTRAHIADGTAQLHAVLAAGLPTGLTERLRVVVDATVAAHTGGHRLHQVLFEQAPRPAEVVDELRAAEDALVEVVAALLADDPAVAVDDPHLAARIVVTTVESLVHRFVTRDPADGDLAALTGELVRMLERYLAGT